jgi:adenylate kinase
MERGGITEYECLRASSNELASPAFIASVDEQLLTEVTRHRLSTNILIDSHAVTRENFGFRVTGSSSSLLDRLKLDCIIVIHAPANERVKRIKTEPKGRLPVSVEEARLHETLQDSVAIAYGLMSACPVFIVEASEEPASLVTKIRAGVFARLGMTLDGMT